MKTKLILVGVILLGVVLFKTLPNDNKCHFQGLLAGFCVLGGIGSLLCSICGSVIEKREQERRDRGYFSKLEN